MQEMPGTRMAFVGIKNDKDIADLWAYLKQFGPDGAKNETRVEATEGSAARRRFALQVGRAGINLPRFA